MHKKELGGGRWRTWIFICDVCTAFPIAMGAALRRKIFLHHLKIQVTLEEPHRIRPIGSSFS